MGNMIDYLKNSGDQVFKEREFQEIDSLIFSKLAYLIWNDAVPHFGRSIRELFYECNPNDFIPHGWDNTLNWNLFQETADSRRFGNLPVGYYEDVLDFSAEEQFAAVSFQLDRHLFYVAFRGTDSTFVGWKEDFKLSFSPDIPSQRSALQYFSKVAAAVDGNFLLGGHSKGGNLAVYAAAMSGLQDRILAVYDHDGPGFSPGFFASDGYLSISSRIHKTIPQTALVGLLLLQHGAYSVVASDAFIYLQHDPYSWTVADNSLIYLEDTTTLSKYTNKTLNSWINSLDTETRKAFCNALYDLLQSTHAKTMNELMSTWRKNIRSVGQHIKNLDPELRRLMRDTIQSLMKASATEMKSLIEQRFSQSFAHSAKKPASAHKQAGNDGHRER